jgi:hypothetical protein
VNLNIHGGNRFWDKLRVEIIFEYKCIFLLLINRNSLLNPPAHDHRRGQARLHVDDYTHCLYACRELTPTIDKYRYRVLIRQAA